MSISQLAREVKESPTLKLNEAARLLKERGEPVIHLGAGEPKSKVPIDAVLASAAKLTSAEIRYTPTEGIPSLIKAIIRYTEENYNKVVGPRNVIAFSGAKQAFYNLMMTIVNPQDEVIIVAPYWVSYPEIVRMVYGVPVIVTPESGRFEPTMADITQQVSSYTKAIVINSPNNPSGAVYSEDFIGEIVQYCEKKGIYLIMDDIYHKLVFSDGKWTPCYKYAKDQSENSRLIVVNGVSKSYAMTGFRIGWTVANQNITAAMINISAQNTSCPSVVAQAAAAGALMGVQSSVESLRLTLENNAKVMVNELRAFNGVVIDPPKGTFYCLPDFRAYQKDSVKLSKFLLDVARVVSVPGKEFGLEGRLRLSFCGTIKEIKEGVARIKWALDPESPNEIYIGDRKMRRDWK
ncbi:MAG TPA: aminotransferase class I/II-fold pyridoxal phosphate-dependent enzyme [candidate division Zixibacteria bacterium]|nr:aminotransferase class I/II-fold pyridoxal phosphate-dependent enzyme [candidate division Zixibacteria bacterium]MDD4918561.1 aminotransferase class I/II-fold pyridoxal phosphate-dependent enzyme [candidate division Zixibacteria bacterium]MDM7971954.1 aminotransferase class I/II-fold pyridoxal phosphate-dependent enzyme [candidate division Zixibacteria bacterium]HOD65621.1 aminotransferase class I/II-fold pyridoxal phosphate-dependent enzyme [candidate division Zixibacteria bacterium]HPM3709